jgi:sodium pump decarboxylase gamma subunit
MIQEGLVLMGAGMGVVGLFLTIMVVVVYGASAVLRRFDKEPPGKGKDAGAKRTGSNDAQLAVAIAAARSRSRG